MRMFLPICFQDVKASHRTEGEVFYRVAYGVERWGDGLAHHVFKVQIVRDGKVEGRMSPSFPEGTDDLERVIAALQEVKAGKGQSGRGEIFPV